MAGAEPKDVRAGFATVTAGTLVLFVATLLLVGFTFVARVLIVRSVSVASWNAFSLGYTLVQVLLAVGTYGITVAVARTLSASRTEAESRTVIRTSLGLGVGVALAAGGGLVLAAPFVGRALGSPQLGAGLGFFGIAIACLIGATVLASIFQGFSNVLPNALFIQIVNPGVFLAFLAVAFTLPLDHALAATLLPAGVDAALRHLTPSAALTLPPDHLSYTDTVAGFAVAAAATLIASLVYAWRALPRHLVRGPGEPASRSKLLHLIAPLLVYGTMVSLAGSGDTLVLGALHYSEVGAYSASLTLARLVQIGISSASYIFLPVASGFLARGERRAVGLTYATVTKWLTLFSLPLFVVFVFLPGRTLAFVYGPGYSHVVLPLQLVVFGAFAGTLLGPAAMAQVACGQSRLLAVNATVAGAVDILLALALVPRYGEVGAAASWAVANVVYGSLCLSELAATQGIHPFGRDFVLPLALVGIPASAALGLAHPTVPFLALPVIAVGVALVFALVIVVSGCVGEGDRLLLGAVEQLVGRPLPFVRRWVARLAPRGR